jgi:photosystem II stability/assembly factor-like uncharacterized protein
MMLRENGRTATAGAAMATVMALATGILCGPLGASGLPPAPAAPANDGARHAAATGSWTLLGPPGQDGLSSFALSPQSARWIYAVGLAASTLYATADGGATWAALPVPPTDDSNSFAAEVAVDPQQPTGIYLASQAFSLGGHSTNLLSHSTDGGGSWTTLPAPATPTWVAVDPQDPQILYTGPPAARSADGGHSWTLPTVLPPGVTNMVIDPASPSIVYALPNSSPSLYKSVDRGLTWTLAGATIGNLDRLAVDPNSSSTLYAAAGGDLEKSVDGGATWRIVYAPADIDHHGVSTVVAAPTIPTTVYGVIMAAAPVSSADGGLTWSSVPNAGLTGAIVDLQIDPQNPRRLIANVGQQGLAAMMVPGPCTPSAAALCLGTGGRFLVTASWAAPPADGAGQAVGLTADTGAFWFFSAANLELLVKVLDGCSLNGHYWAFAAGLTNVGVTLTVTDTQTGESRTYTNPAGAPFPALQDTAAFDTCP